MRFKMGVLLAALLLLSSGQSAGQEPTHADFGIKPNRTITATGGKATVAEGESVEIVGVSDLASDVADVWDANGRLLDRQSAELFWTILDDRPPAKEGDTQLGRETPEEYLRRLHGKDPDGRTIAIAFRLTGGLTSALDVRADIDKTFVLNVSDTRLPQGSGPSAYVGVARILKPVFPKDTVATKFDFRLEVPGGAWTKIVEFPFGEDTKLRDGQIDAVMRYMDYSDYREIDGVREIVDYKGYYLTLTLPEALRGAELEVLTNDPAGDAVRLPPVVTQHIRGEDLGKEFAGKDLFLVYGLRERGATRKFTLRARHKRIVEFKGIPFVRG
jgi:hypothetical protein